VEKKIFIDIPQEKGELNATKRGAGKQLHTGSSGSGKKKRKSNGKRRKRPCPSRGETENFAG